MSKTAIGIDIGSRATKIVWVQNGKILRSEIFDTGHNPISRVIELLGDPDDASIIATGYGRHLAEAALSCRTITEIRACARGVHHLCPDCNSVVDIGGQDSKVIELTDSGKAERFEMNDRCAAGTGRFLEVMAKALGYSLEEFGTDALSAERPVQVNSMCTVFAETEVVSLIARGENRHCIARGLHVAVARRIAAMASRIRLGKKTLFVGGVARNPCMVKALSDELDGQLVVVPKEPEFAVALGAALVGLETEARRRG